MTTWKASLFKVLSYTFMKNSKAIFILKGPKVWFIKFYNLPRQCDTMTCHSNIVQNQTNITLAKLTFYKIYLTITFHLMLFALIMHLHKHVKVSDPSWFQAHIQRKSYLRIDMSNNSRIANKFTLPPKTKLQGQLSICFANAPK